MASSSWDVPPGKGPVLRGDTSVLASSLGTGMLLKAVLPNRGPSRLGTCALSPELCSSIPRGPRLPQDISLLGQEKVQCQLIKPMGRPELERKAAHDMKKIDFQPSPVNRGKDCPEANVALTPRDVQSPFAGTGSGSLDRVFSFTAALSRRHRLSTAAC